MAWFMFQALHNTSPILKTAHKLSVGQSHGSPLLLNEKAHPFSFGRSHNSDPVSKQLKLDSAHLTEPEIHTEYASEADSVMVQQGSQLTERLSHSTEKICAEDTKVEEKVHQQRRRGKITTATEHFSTGSNADHINVTDCANHNNFCSCGNCTAYYNNKMCSRSRVAGDRGVTEMVETDMRDSQLDGSEGKVTGDLARSHHCRSLVKTPLIHQEKTVDHVDGTHHQRVICKHDVGETADFSSQISNASNQMSSVALATSQEAADHVVDPVLHGSCRLDKDTHNHLCTAVNINNNCVELNGNNINKQFTNMSQPAHRNAKNIASSDNLDAKSSTCMDTCMLCSQNSKAFDGSYSQDRVLLPHDRMFPHVHNTNKTSSHHLTSCTERSDHFDLPTHDKISRYHHNHDLKDLFNDTDSMDKRSTDLSSSLKCKTPEETVRAENAPLQYRDHQYESGRKISEFGGLWNASTSRLSNTRHAQSSSNDSSVMFSQIADRKTQVISESPTNIKPLSKTTKKQFTEKCQAHSGPSLDFSTPDSAKQNKDQLNQSSSSCDYSVSKHLSKSRNISIDQEQKDLQTICFVLSFLSVSKCQDIESQLSLLRERMRYQTILCEYLVKRTKLLSSEVRRQTEASDRLNQSLQEQQSHMTKFAHDTYRMLRKQQRVNEQLFMCVQHLRNKHSIGNIMFETAVVMSTMYVVSIVTNSVLHAILMSVNKRSLLHGNMRLKKLIRYVMALQGVLVLRVIGQRTAGICRRLLSWVSGAMTLNWYRKRLA